MAIGGIGSAGVGSGGMRTKVEAARIATAAGIETHLVNLGKLDHLMHGAVVGTKFVANENRKGSRLFWLEHAANSHGKIKVDTGAVAALIERGVSLLPVGVTEIIGEFAEGDTVEVVGPDEVIIARGITAYSSTELPKLIGKSTKELGALYGSDYEREVIHRDDLVLIIN
jgi:glutamate 5-kinase